MNQTCTEKLYTLKEACELLSISTATGRNWIKSGRLVSAAVSGKTPVFSEDILLSLKNALSSDALSSLKSRRNKSYINKKQTYHSYIAKDSENHVALNQVFHILENDKVILDETLLLCLLRSCAKQLILSSGATNPELFYPLLEDLIPSRIFNYFKKEHTALHEISYTYIPNEDTLGFLYLSLCNLRDRKASGSYYTPGWLAKRLVEQHLPIIDSTQRILDPSCGTGIFLLQLPNNLPLSNLYGTDLNPVSVALTRINLAIKYKITLPEDVSILRKNIINSDFLNQTTPPRKSSSLLSAVNTYDIILGNPPWGAQLSTDEKKLYKQHYSCATSNSVDVFDLFIEQSLNCLTSKGILSFVLPEALLTVKSHTTARELLLQTASVLSVEYLGEVFEHVHCPSIILTVTKDTDRPFFKNVHVTTPNFSFSTSVERAFQADSFSFFTTDEEYLLLQKILARPNCTTLVDHADFALGIVTGNNTGLLHSKPAPGLEPVIKGCDLSKYHINSHSGYLLFQPEKFQQTAPEQFYRAPEKLFYRFINKQLMFAYDNTGLLSLNSCNILIPHIEGLSMKYILAILNSGVAQFIFQKKFRSVKVLRSHLEQIPIPLADKKAQEEIVALVDLLMIINESSLDYKKTFATLDKRIAGLFGLTQEEYKLIRI